VRLPDAPGPGPRSSVPKMRLVGASELAGGPGLAGARTRQPAGASGRERTLDQVSFNVSVRLKTGWPGVESGSAAK